VLKTLIFVGRPQLAATSDCWEQTLCLGPSQPHLVIEFIAINALAIDRRSAVYWQVKIASFNAGGCMLQHVHQLFYGETMPSGQAVSRSGVHRGSDFDGPLKQAGRGHARA
jgi:hypothetical protein